MAYTGCIDYKRIDDSSSVVNDINSIIFQQDLGIYFYDINTYIGEVNNMHGNCITDPTEITNSMIEQITALKKELNILNNALMTTLHDFKNAEDINNEAIEKVREQFAKSAALAGIAGTSTTLKNIKDINFATSIDDFGNNMDKSVKDFMSEQYIDSHPVEFDSVEEWEKALREKYSRPGRSQENVDKLVEAEMSKWRHEQTGATIAGIAISQAGEKYEDIKAETKKLQEKYNLTSKEAEELAKAKQKIKDAEKEHQKSPNNETATSISKAKNELNDLKDKYGVNKIDELTKKYQEEFGLSEKDAHELAQKEQAYLKADADKNDAVTRAVAKDKYKELIECKEKLGIDSKLESQKGDSTTDTTDSNSTATSSQENSQPSGGNNQGNSNPNGNSQPSGNTKPILNREEEQDTDKVPDISFEKDDTANDKIDTTPGEDAKDVEIIDDGKKDPNNDTTKPSDDKNQGNDTTKPSDDKNQGNDTTKPSDDKNQGNDTTKPSDDKNQGNDTTKPSDDKNQNTDTTKPTPPPTNSNTKPVTPPSNNNNSNNGYKPPQNQQPQQPEQTPPTTDNPIVYPPKEPPTLDDGIIHIEKPTPSPTTGNSKSGSNVLPIGLGLAAAGVAAVAGVKYVSNKKNENESIDDNYNYENNDLLQDDPTVSNEEPIYTEEYLTDQEDDENLLPEEATQPFKYQAGTVNKLKIEDGYNVNFETDIEEKEELE